ncbi:MAG TPA: hypothetical protein VHZ73_06770, partial [Vicinamibacterales bacterium]|nr:hypothetical protein [Vicinamibacterales bacterium]
MASFFLRHIIAAGSVPVKPGGANKSWYIPAAMRARLFYLGAAALVAVLALASVLVATASAEMTPTGDMAIIESYTIEAAAGRLLVGPYSRFQWHHPGPLYFYWLAPFYSASHHLTAGLSAGALVLAVGMIVLASVTALASGDAISAVAVAAALTLYLFRASELFTSAWNPHAVVLPLAVTVLVSAAAASGRAWLLPVAAFTASLAAQTHIGTVPVALSVSLCATIAVAVQRRWKPLLWALGVAGVLWLPALVEQLVDQPGNLTAMWSFFTSDAARGQPLRVAFLAWASMLASIVRPGFSVTEGGLLRMHRSAALAAWAIAELVLLGVGAAVATHRRRRFEAAFALFSLAASLVALWSVTRVEGDVMGYEILWISALGALNIGAIAAALGAAMTPSRGVHRLAIGVCLALLVACASSGVSHLVDVRSRSRSPGPETLAIGEAAAGIHEYLGREHVVRPLVDVDQKSWGLAAAVLLQLQKAGVSYAVDDDWLPMFTARARAAGNETMTLSIAGAERHVLIHDRQGVTPVL